jgi:hypothetical protein
VSNPPRRFPPPWTVEETAPCFIVRDADKQALALVYYEDEPERRAAAKLLTRDEARRIAVTVAQAAGAPGRASPPETEAHVALRTAYRMLAWYGSWFRTEGTLDLAAYAKHLVAAHAFFAGLLFLGFWLFVLIATAALVTCSQNSKSFLITANAVHRQPHRARKARSIERESLPCRWDRRC